MNKVGIQICLVVVLMISFFACDQSRIYEEYKKIPQSGWHKDSLAVFDVAVEDTLLNHNLYINIRNDINYNFSNLWLFIEIDQPRGISTKDTLEVLLADPSGKWLGDGFAGKKTRQVIYKGGVYFPTSGNYSISVQHGMRDNILKGISDVGFRVEKTK